MIEHEDLRDGNINVLVSRTGPLTKEYDTVAFPVSAGLRGSAVLAIGLYIAHFDNQEVNFDHQMQSECTGTYFAAPQ